MSTTSEEQALRSALTDAVAGQPVAPHDRIDAVRRRHAHRRQRQLAAIATTAVVAVAGATLGLLHARSGGEGDTQFAKRDLPSWAVQWPEHRDTSIPDAYLATAYTSWRLDNPDVAIGSGAQVVWYLAEPIPHGRLALAFEVGGPDTVPLFVVGTTDAASLTTYSTTHFSSNTSLWAESWHVFASGVGTTSVVGMYSTVSDASSGRNTVVLLTDPRARSAEVGYVGESGHVSKTLPMTAGFAAVELGPLRSRVHVVSVDDAGGHRLAGDLDVGVPTADDNPDSEPGSFTPRLMPIPSLHDVPADPGGFGEMDGQEPYFEASVSPTWPLHSTRIYARCFGRATSIALHIDSDSPAQTVTVPCDDREHVVDGPGFLPTGTTSDTSNLNPGGVKGVVHTVDVFTDQETAWRAVVVAR